MRGFVWKENDSGTMARSQSLVKQLDWTIVLELCVPLNFVDGLFV